MTGRTTVLTYGAPLVGAVLLAAGLAGAILGGYSIVQQEGGLCDEPILTVSTATQTEAKLQRLDGPTPQLPRRQFSALSRAEQQAFEDALGSQRREGTVDGELQHRRLLTRGVVVEYRGTGYYTTLASDNACLDADPLVLPLGLVAVVLGVVGVLTPPLYRRYIEFERRQQS